VLRASIVRRIEKLETCFEPLNPQFPQVDSSLLLDSELSYFSQEMRILRLKAREIGYGDGVEGNIHNVGWFDLGNFDPMINDEVKLECLKALNEDGRRVMETLREIMLKAVRLTEALSEEEKSLIRDYNEALWHSSEDLAVDGAKRFTDKDLADLRLGYNQIMVKYGEKVFE